MMTVQVCPMDAMAVLNASPGTDRRGRKMSEGLPQGMQLQLQPAPQDRVCVCVCVHVCA